MSNEKIIPQWAAQHASERALWCIKFLRLHEHLTESEFWKVRARIAKELQKVAKAEAKAAVKAAAYEKAQKEAAKLEAEGA